MLSLLPEREAALYSTVVVLILLGSAFSLLELVYTQRRPQTVSDAGELPATGGSSA